MTPGAIAICIFCQCLIVAGQIFLKRGMTASSTKAIHFGSLAFGIFLMAIWFFLWLGLMARWDLSKLFPFEGLNPAIMAIAAWLVLKEKMGVHAWVGICLVSAGIVVVSRS